MPEEVRVVALLPNENQVRSGHELGHEAAPLGGARKRIGADTRPAGVITCVVVLPELLVFLGKQELALDDEPALVGRFLRHAGKVSGLSGEYGALWPVKTE
jgi:hypothetical protein